MAKVQMAAEVQLTDTRMADAQLAIQALTYEVGYFDNIWSHHDAAVAELYGILTQTQRSEWPQVVKDQLKLTRSASYWGF